MSNMQIWNQVEATDPDMTERVNFGAFKFTTIDAQYQIKRATEVFGPCGLGWGLRNQKFEMLTVDPTDAHYNLLCFTAELWYKHQDQEGCNEIAADIELFENTKNGWKRVSDPMKKVRTDALTKGLSWLGFSADVFMGRFDDARYVQGLHQNKRQQSQRPKEDPELTMIKGKIFGLSRFLEWSQEALNDFSLLTVKVQPKELDLDLAQKLFNEMIEVKNQQEQEAVA